jgi:hypothetical protein
MRIRIFGMLAVLCALMFATPSGKQVLAQSKSEKPVMYTYVSEWTVPRALWGDYLKNDAADNEMLKKAVADGSLVSYGSFTVLTHQEGQPTHGSWFSAGSMADILKFLEGLRTTPGATSAPLAAAKHWDYVLESRDYDAHSGTFTNGYLRVANWRSKPGGDREGQIIRATVVPLLEKLMADGALHAYQVDQEAVHSSDPGSFDIVIITNGPEGIDKFHKAVEEAEKSNPAAWAGFGSSVESAGHRDMLARVSSMTHK